MSVIYLLARFQYGGEIVQTTTSEQIMLKMVHVKVNVVRKTSKRDERFGGSNPSLSAQVSDYQIFTIYLLSFVLKYEVVYGR